LQYDEAEGLFFGGLFWDGRATGWSLHDPAAEQAKGPFLNEREQNLPNYSELVKRVCAAQYGQMFKMEFPGACNVGNEAAAYDKIGIALSAFEASPMVNRYSSKYDRYLRGEATLTSLERKGLQLFKGKAQCALCHPADLDENGNPPLFTDNTFDNLGLPINEANPYYEDFPEFVDVGLGGFLESPELAATPFARLADYAAENMGKQSVPTLRNVDKRPSADFVKAYGHNGVFKSLKTIIHFYNTRDVLPYCDQVKKVKVGQTCWPRPEYAGNINTDELGNLSLTGDEEDALVAFLKTLSDE
jgi:cytochrome c peroxidase